MSFIRKRFWMLVQVLTLSIGVGSFQQSHCCQGQENEANRPSLAIPGEEDANDQPRIKELAEFLTNTLWKGQFTKVDKNGAVGKAVEESYEITKAEKLPQENLWMLTARIKYGKRDVTVPLPINILWAGQTPVITVDQLLIPGMGTFDARVLIRGGKYSGTWTHNDQGGHLFGAIKKMKGKSETSPTTE